MFEHGPAFSVFTKGTPVPNGIGGSTIPETASFTIHGFLDMLTGTDIRGNVVNNAYIIDSSHVLLTDIDTRLQKGLRIDETATGTKYRVIYVDNPVSLGKHLEVYLKREV